MNAATLSSDSIVEEVTINASAERIFEALTNPTELLKWWGSEGKFQAVRVECELRPGGRWLIVSEGNCTTGKTSRVTGQYREIDRPRLLTFTWVRDEEDGVETLVRWELEERCGVTTVRLTHSGLNSESLRARNDGWPLILGLLHAYVKRHDQSRNEQLGRAPE
jgi:uncharacterized protein YndB with AHSA1/START domain